MALNQQLSFISEQDYLAGELISTIKHEYINGDVYAMAGGSTNHNRITVNMVRKLGDHLENTPCEPFSADMKVKAGNDFFYPDVLVVCHHQNHDLYYTESPIIIVEVLSKATRRIDQNLKRQAYQSLPSLEECVLIEQDLVAVEICRRANHWQPEYYYLGDVAYFAAIDLHLPVEAIYARVFNPEMQKFLARSHQQSS